MGPSTLLLPCLLLLSSSSSPAQGQNIERRLGPLREVFAWKQLTFDINGHTLLRDRFGGIDEASEADAEADVEATRERRQADSVYFIQPDSDRNQGEQGNANNRPNSSYGGGNRPNQNNGNRPNQNNGNRPSQSNGNRPNNGFENQGSGNGGSRPTVTSTTARPSNESGRFFVQYNNVPMGVERVGNRLFVTVPRRRFGIPSTLNYIDLTRSSNTRSPSLKPYPSLRQGSSLVSIYRTRADSCGRLWAVDTGLWEIPDNRRQVQPPAIVIFDLNRNRQIKRYEFKSTDIPSENTPAGLASITIDMKDGDCANAFAYVPDLNTNGIIVYSLREDDSWRLTHNYMHFNPLASNLNIAGQRFQWNDGIFSITLSPTSSDGCRVAYFHPMVSTQEFSVSTCVLKNRTAADGSDYWTRFNLLGERGANSQSTMHGLHDRTGVVFYADVGRNALSCWNSATQLVSSNVVILAQDSTRLSYPSDLHVTGDEVWLMVNSMPRFIYSRLDTNEYSFFIYRGSVNDLIMNTPCADGLTLGLSSS
ncbi:L-dopachrome tautomerase yellow-f [Plutella xylostella]|uniref:L-dopachrome tautomerase yellow-f n=1 Tax=Plutella xylostella TaxID=51655 RepID=UPI002032E365|nr:L-dopachrome tautomerase yellow-f [Plutella xylostella]